MEKFELKERFSDRHIGPTDLELKEMLSDIGVDSLKDLIDKTIPPQIRLKEKIKLDPEKTEYEFLNELRELAAKNKIYDSYIGLGYYSTITPPVIIRNILENPGWYTSYTPYQAEISQGRLEALLNFQTVVSDLTGLELANASLLDEGTAAAEAMIMFHNSRKKEKKDANVFLVSEECFPQTIDILRTRAVPLGIEVKIGDHRNFDLNENVFGLIVQYPSGNGQIYDYKELFNKAAELNIYKAVTADILSLALLKAPSEFGADAAVGTTQRFGVPMGFGGPHAAYFATRDEFKRQVPGRIIGVSVDAKERRALRMALQTREQHIKREKATSNICTAQVLLAIMAGMYAAYHGPHGIKRIATKINNLAQLLSNGLKELGYNQINTLYFDTLKIDAGSKEKSQKIKELAESKKMNFRYFDESFIGISLGETTSYENVKTILEIFAKASNKLINEINFSSIEENVVGDFFGNLSREKEFLTHPVFNSFRSETEMMRYIKSLEKKDLSLNHSMIPLGSCTMKLNAATEMFPITWPEFFQLHPFIPENQSLGYKELLNELEKQLCAITGFAAVSLQPNSGAQGEYAGLMVIREYHISRGDGHRNVILIPSSAHGTNPASAVMAGGKVVIVKCDEKGNIDTNDLREKAEANKENLSAIMVTYPSTHGVFEENIKEVCQIIHDNGGQVYMDGANLNAQLGLTHPKEIGADVCHLNLHKTFCIPHGGGGPGMGPIGGAEQLVPFLPGHSIVKIGNGNALTAVSAAPWGSANILPISYAYIKMMGEEGLTESTMYAILNANYIKTKLQKHYKVLYSGSKGFVAHELIFDMREFKQSCGIEVEDIAKRLMDYGYHAPTVSFPVPGTLMVEPTESESKAELDQFCEAMLLIREEISAVEKGEYDKEDNPLKNAPHTAQDVISDEWTHSYSREKAAFPTEWTKANKFWPSVGRVNNAYGDRNLVCSCLPVEAYETVEV